MSKRSMSKIDYIIGLDRDNTFKARITYDTGHPLKKFVNKIWDEQSADVMASLFVSNPDYFKQAKFL